MHPYITRASCGNTDSDSAWGGIRDSEFLVRSSGADAAGQWSGLGVGRFQCRYYEQNTGSGGRKTK